MSKIEETKEEILKEIEGVKSDLVDIEEIVAEEVKADKKARGVMMYVFILIFIAIVAGLGYWYYNKKGSEGAVIPKKEAVDKALEFIKKNLAPGMDLKLGDVDEKTKTFYRFVVKAGEQNVPTYVSLDGKTLVFQETDMSKDPNAKATDPAATPSQNAQIDGKNVVDGANGFKEVQGADICKENGKPIVYFFGSETCPHCKWEKPIIDAVANTFGSKISYHKNIDNQKDQDVFAKFNKEGGIPTIIIGCKYFRIGSGESAGEAAEKQTLTDAINNVLK